MAPLWHNWPVILLALCAGSRVAAGQDGEGGIREPGLRADSNLVLINASVIDREGRFVSGLDKASFRLLDEGFPVRLRAFSLEDAPVSTLILLDMSSSMKSGIAQIREGLQRYLKAARPGDDFCLITFQRSVEGQCNFTKDADAILQQVPTGQPSGGTALIDALKLALDQVKRGSNARKIVLVLTDGVDTASRAQWKELENQAKETTAGIYAVVPPYWEDDFEWHSLLQMIKVVQTTGGRYYKLRNRKEYPEFLENLDVRRQYVLGFTPPPMELDGKYHVVKVELAGKRDQALKVYWRRGYFGPREVQ